MKKLSYVALSLAALIVMFASTFNLESAPRKILFEEFTNASCGPCAGQNPMIMEFLNANKSNVIPVFYHVSWPGSDDPMYQFNTMMNDARTTYYNVSSVPNSVIQGNAFNGYPSLTSYNSALQTVLAKGESPITLTINVAKTGTLSNVTVNVATTTAISGKKLYIALCEAYHYYSDAGNNGEEDFYYIARKLLPTNSGNSLTIAAGGNMDYNAQFLDDPEWNNDLMYVVAFVQDDATKEVLQANSTSIPSPYQGVLTINNPWIRINPNTTINIPVTITNENNLEFSGTIAINTDNSNIPSGWTAVLSQESVTIPANNSISVNLSVTANETIGFGYFNLSLTPGAVPQGYFSKETQAVCGALSSNTKGVIWHSGSLACQAMTDVVANYNNGYFLDKLVAMELSETFITAYPPQTFDWGFFALNYSESGYLGQTYAINTPLVNAIRNMYLGGKKIFLTSEQALSLASGTSYPSTAALDFFNNYLKVGINGTALRVQTDEDGYITAGIPFPVTGFAGDPIGGGMSYTLNTADFSTTYLTTWFTDFLKVVSTDGSTVPFIYYDNNTTHIAGVHAQQNNGKMVYITFGLEGFANAAERRAFGAKCLDWLTAGSLGPIISTVTQEIDFEYVVVNQHSDIGLSIQNTGTEPLTISDISFDADQFSLYNPPDFPVVIPSGGELDITIRFSPDVVDLFLAEMTITSNAANYPTYKIGLVGEGIEVSGPSISTELEGNLLDYGLKEIDDTYEQSVFLKNKGNEDCNITFVGLSENEDDVYFIESGDGAGKISAGGEREIVVSFSPKEKDKTYNGTIEIESNATNAPTFYVYLIGTGKYTSGVYEGNTAITSIFEIAANPNPMTESSIIEFTVQSNSIIDVNLNLIDINGKVIKNVVNGSYANGGYSVNLDVTALPSGSYYIVGTAGGSNVKIPIIVNK
jgi:hypothetical protein